MALFKTHAFYTPKLLKTHSDKLFVFGDNLERVGKGGQAVIRSMPNARGVATKVSPDSRPNAFFWDESIYRHIGDVLNDLEKVKDQSGNHHIVIPFTEDNRISLGLGLARLDHTSPVTYSFIAQYFKSLAKMKGGWNHL